MAHREHPHEHAKLKKLTPPKLKRCRARLRPIEHSCNFCEQRRPCTDLYRCHGLRHEDQVAFVAAHYVMAANLTPPQHLFYFSRVTLLKMLSKAGFEPVEISYPWKLVPWRLVLYQIGPQVKAARGALGRLPFGLYVNLFDAVFVIARKK